MVGAKTHCLAGQLVLLSSYHPATKHKQSATLQLVENVQGFTHTKVNVMHSLTNTGSITTLDEQKDMSAAVNMCNLEGTTLQVNNASLCMQHAIGAGVLVRACLSSYLDGNAALAARLPHS